MIPGPLPRSSGAFGSWELERWELGVGELGVEGWDQSRAGRDGNDPPTGPRAGSEIARIDVVALDQPPESPAILVGRTGRLRDVAVVSAQHRDDVLALEGRDRTRACRAEGSGRCLGRLGQRFAFGQRGPKV